MINRAPVVKDVCLVGGGHSHTLLLRQWAMQPMAGVRLTLVSSAVQTPYSGMLPGLIAGHYGFDAIHIDLLRLCDWAEVRFIEDTVVALDLDTRQVQFRQRPALSFDVLSLDTGSTPDLSVPGSAHHVMPVKPVSDFHARWQQIARRLAQPGADYVSIGVVGSGAGGFELATAMHHRLKNTRARVFWVLRSNEAISGRPARVGQLAMAAARAAGIEIVHDFNVVSVEAGKLLAADARSLMLDEIIWCTAATGPGWPASAGLGTDQRGFVATNAFLQSVSHPFVFATGDIGTQIHTPSHKAGVFAVRQAPVLFENLRRYLLGEKLKPYAPQKDFLSLMATGGKQGIANRGPLVVSGSWVWRWKDHIDQRFMNRFRHLPARNMNASLAILPDALRTPSLAAGMRCRGCGAKVGSDVLTRVLDELMPVPLKHDTDLPASPAGDTAVIDLPQRRLVQSVDQINAIVDDPWLLGRIAVLHAISDVVTVDASVHSAQIIVTLPEAGANVVERDLGLVMSGVLTALKEESCQLIGGHTTQGPELSVAVVVNATSLDRLNEQPNACVSKRSVQTGDTLILTKALGVGTLFAGTMHGKAYGPDVMLAIDSMLLSNRVAADILREHDCHAMTDVTGFGLLGHLNRLLCGVSCTNESDEPSTQGNSTIPGATVVLDQVPFLTGAVTLSKQGIKSSLFMQNRHALDQAVLDPACNSAMARLLIDPQTSGGLLAIVPAIAQSACIEALHSHGCIAAAAVGQLEGSAGAVHIRQSARTA